jgi:hypothetical protein
MKVTYYGKKKRKKENPGDCVEKKKKKYRYLGENPRYLHIPFQCVVLFFVHTPL